MAWKMTRGQVLQVVSLIVLSCAWAAGHFDTLPPVLQQYRQWIELVAGIGSVIQAFLITPPPALQQPRQEWTAEERAQHKEDK
jgi:hypothetical protein